MAASVSTCNNLHTCIFNQVIITMGVNIKDNKLIIIAKPKTIRFDLTKDVCNDSKYEINSIKKHNEFLADHLIKNEIS